MGRLTAWTLAGLALCASAARGGEEAEPPNPFGIKKALRPEAVPGKLVRSGEFSNLKTERACLVGGDFNDWRSLLHPIFTEILSFGCATQRRTGYDGSIRTYPSFSPTGGLDKIYYRGPIRALSARSCRLRVSRVASDHLPVVADFELH